MPCLLIFVKKTAWNRDAWPSYVQDGDVPGDCTSDLRTSGNCLSVWTMDDDRGNLERVATAFAANRNSCSNVDYVIFERRAIEELGIEICKTPGGTPDSEANQRYHHDLMDLTGSRIVSVALAISRNMESGRIPQKRVLQCLKDGITGQQLDPAKMDERLRIKLTQDLASKQN